MSAHVLRSGGRINAWLGLLLSALLVGCAGGADKPKPTELGPNAALINVRLAWSARLGRVDLPLDVRVSGNTVTLASSDGTVVAIDAATGQDLWRTRLATTLEAGAGSDGRYAAVVSSANELIVLEAGRELWRERLGALTYTAPLVAGARVFVMTADRAIAAFDAQSGRRLWTYVRQGEQLLALRQAGTLFAAGDTLVAGLSGRLVGLNPLNGSVRWEGVIANPRGTNDVERLVDIVGRVSRDGDVACARAFQASVGCVNTVRGSLLWTKSANGAQGVHGDGEMVVGTEADGRVIAWRRTDGERIWTSERLKYRDLTAPQFLGRSIAIGDVQGFVHFLARQDGAPLARVATDGSPIAAAPVLVANTLVVVTRNGGVFGFRPD
ncbi:MAG: outer membrane protein assembly factor BamB [Rhodoferax sp.]|nr:outer membrane protein assembly factor BamB [Rhodoferax sp.]